ncbi:MAG: 16S rRNA (uracil(1498)-N(3))-methyltransferase [Truepera sp.]|nr:16S rRNA (uracil(1498)-N(3))-methyltransferase [Truepera sp.]
MRVHRVLVYPLTVGEVRLLGREAYHLVQVLRVKPGDAVRAFDGGGLEAEGVVQQVAGPVVVLKLCEPRPTEREVVPVTLALALLKGDKLAEVVRQATELGAVRFIPFVSRHCEVRELSVQRLTRWRRIAQEAAKQSGRSVVPEVSELLGLEQLPKSAERILVAHPYADTTLAAHLQQAPLVPHQPLLVVTGPEGGLRDTEVAHLVALGAVAIRLGPRILRAETAPLALLSALLVPEGL